MNTEVRQFKYFFNSQAFADGLRITFAILFPSILLTYLHLFSIGLTISLGAMCVSLTDAPGPFLHKRNGMLFSCFFIFIISFITVFARLNIYTMGIEILLICFLFSMLNVYGNRATSVANGSMLIMILLMDKPIPPSEAFSNSILILIGGIFYMSVSLLLYKLRPYRIAQRALGESIYEVAKYLSIKADFYDPLTDLEKNYKNLLNHQIIVNEKQDFVREILFKTRQIVSESTEIGKQLVFTFINTVDLFEAITASYYDYKLIRTQFHNSGILEKISSLIKRMSDELMNISFAIQSNSIYKSSMNYSTELIAINNEIEHLAENHGNKLVLKKILVNLRRLFQSLNDINLYFSVHKKSPSNSNLDHSKFTSHQSLNAAILWNNLSFKSSVFKHSIRVSCACILGYIIAKSISNAHHSYWILMTITFMLKPAFSLTKQRNIQRIKGTIAGAAIGVFILIFIHNRDVLFWILVFFMLGTYSFIRINYLVTVTFITPYVLILFSFLGIEFITVAEERLFDTMLGCSIAFAASYFLFPHWESSKIRYYMQEMITSNMNYLNQILKGLNGDEINMLDYKLSRKDVYVSSANLSSAFQRMLSEPKSKHTSGEDVHQFVVLNLILLSNIATVGTTLVSSKPVKYSKEIRNIALNALRHLHEAKNNMNDREEKFTSVEFEHESHNNSIEIHSEDEFLEDQMKFIYKICVDIERSIKNLLIHKPLYS